MRITKISKRSVFYNLSAIALSNTLLQILGFLYRIFLSRVTGAEGLGVYQLVMPFYSVVTSITLTGLTVAVARISASCAGVGDFCGARRAVSLSRKIFTFSLIAIAAITLFNSRAVSSGILGDSRTNAALPFVFICLFLTGLENIFKNYFYGVGKVVPQIVSELSEQVIRFLAVAALLLCLRPSDPGKAAMLIFIGMTVSELFSSSLLTLFYQPEKWRMSSRRKDPPELSHILSVALPVSAAATVNNLLSSLNSVLIPRRLISAGFNLKAATESFGVLFGMTMPLLTFPIAFIASITSVMVPKISEVYACGNESDMRRKAGKTIHATSLLAMPCMAILIPIGQPLCRLLFAHDAAGEFMLPLAVATLFSYYELSTGALLNGIGLQKRAAVYIIISGIIQLAFTWCVGIPSIGMHGFVAGYIVSCGVCAALNFFCLVRHLKLRPRYANWFLFPLLASALASLICDIAYKLFLFRALSLALSLILSGACGLIVYALSLSALGTNIIRYIKTLIPSEK